MRKQRRCRLQQRPHAKLSRAIHAFDLKTESEGSDPANAVERTILAWGGEQYYERGLFHCCKVSLLGTHKEDACRRIVAVCLA